MKASITFREDQNPILRAKLPLHLFQFRFRSAIEVADPDDLSLSFSTFFRSGPSFQLSYRPNDSSNPFTLGVKSGIGLFGSPMNAPITVTADFDLLRNGGSRFFLHFRPQVGDFTLKRSIQSQKANLPHQSSIFTPARVGDGDFGLNKGKSIDGGETSKLSDADAPPGNPIFINCSQILNCIDDALSSVEISARTTLKVRDRAAVKFRWSMNWDDFTAKNPFFRMPCLGLRKIGIERVATEEGVQESDAAAGEYSAMKKQLEDLRADSQSLKKNMDQLRAEIGYQKPAPLSPPVKSPKKRGA